MLCCVYGPFEVSVALYIGDPQSLHFKTTHSARKVWSWIGGALKMQGCLYWNCKTCQWCLVLKGIPKWRGHKLQRPGCLQYFLMWKPPTLHSVTTKIWSADLPGTVEYAITTSAFSWVCGTSRLIFASLSCNRSSRSAWSTWGDRFPDVGEASVSELSPVSPPPIPSDTAPGSIQSNLF